MNTPLKYYTQWQAHSWESIEEHFTKNFEGKHIQLLKLVQHIRQSGLSNRLFALASMDKLVVSVYEQLDVRKEALHISFDLRSRKWRFEYFAKPFSETEFVRTYEEGKGIEKFDNFLKMINW